MYIYLYLYLIYIYISIVLSINGGWLFKFGNKGEAEIFFLEKKGLD